MERRALLRWTIFQVLIGNTDAHAKNLSFMSTHAGLSLAPAYDLLCGRAFSAKHIDQTYAMAIGDAFEPEAVSAYEWAVLCVQAKLNPNQVKKELMQLAEATRIALPVVATQVSAEGADMRMVMEVCALVEVQCARQFAMAALIPEMAKDARQT